MGFKVSFAVLFVSIVATASAAPFKVHEEEIFKTVCRRCGSYDYINNLTGAQLQVPADDHANCRKCPSFHTKLIVDASGEVSVEITSPVVATVRAASFKMHEEDIFRTVCMRCGSYLYINNLTGAEFQVPADDHANCRKCPSFHTKLIVDASGEISVEVTSPSANSRVKRVVAGVQSRPTTGTGALKGVTGMAKTATKAAPKVALKTGSTIGLKTGGSFAAAGTKTVKTPVKVEGASAVKTGGSLAAAGSKTVKTGEATAAKPTTNTAAKQPGGKNMKLSATSTSAKSNKPSLTDSVTATVSKAAADAAKKVVSDPASVIDKISQVAALIPASTGSSNSGSSPSQTQVVQDAKPEIAPVKPAENQASLESDDESFTTEVIATTPKPVPSSPTKKPTSTVTPRPTKKAN